jgi:hypothetical protein
LLQLVLFARPAFSEPAGDHLQRPPEHDRDQDRDGAPDQAVRAAREKRKHAQRARTAAASGCLARRSQAAVNGRAMSSSERRSALTARKIAITPVAIIRPVAPGKQASTLRRIGLVQRRETRELALQGAHGEFALEKSLDYVWVELPARLRDDQRRGVFPAAGNPVGPVVG